MKNPPRVPNLLAPAVSLQGVSIWYGAHCAVREVSLLAPGGDITALIGPSGCGKTSLLNCMNQICRLMSGCRMDGQMLIGTDDVHAPGLDLLHLRRRVGMIFQKPNPFPLSIRRNLELPLAEHGLARGERDAAVQQALTDAGLWDEVKDRLDTPALLLSGGQKQRLCIARAIALQPEVLLMDEPCSALDPIASAVVEDLILRLKRRYTVIIVTHNLAQARRISDHTAVMWNQDGAGQLVEFGPTAALFSAPRQPITAAYIEGRKG